MRTLLLLATSLISCLPTTGQEATGQEPRPAEAARDAAATELQQRLLATAAAGPTAFAAEWVWPAGDLQRPIRPAAAPPEPAPDRARGAFAADVLHVVFAGASPLELRQHGRHWLLREGAGPFRLAHAQAGPIADRPFVPDPPLLLRALAAGAPRVLDRTIGEADGRPVEWFALELDTGHCEVLRFAGAIGDPSPVPAGVRALVQTRGLQAHLPKPTVDVAVEIDVGTRYVQRIRVVSLSRRIDTTRLRAAAGGRGAGIDDAEPVVDEPEPMPTVFREGLPVREQGDRQRRWFEVRLREHGAATIDALDEASRALLGR